MALRCVHNGSVAVLPARGRRLKSVCRAVAHGHFQHHTERTRRVPGLVAKFRTVGVSAYTPPCGWTRKCYPARRHRMSHKGTAQWGVFPVAEAHIERQAGGGLHRLCHSVCMSCRQIISCGWVHRRSKGGAGCGTVGVGWAHRCEPRNVCSMCLPFEPLQRTCRGSPICRCQAVPRPRWCGHPRGWRSRPMPGTAPFGHT